MHEKIVHIHLSVEDEVPGSINFEEEYTDVIVCFEGGPTYAATFFAFKNVEIIRNAQRCSGENLGGKYFWKPCMLLIDNCSRKSVEAVVKHLMEEGDFLSVFKKVMK